MRRQDRIQIEVPVDVMWTDRQGLERFATARSIDVCESGIRIKVPELLPDRSFVRLRADKIALAGSASVRTCLKKGTKYVVGLEFSGGLKWKRPKDAKPREAPVQALEPEPASR